MEDAVQTPVEKGKSKTLLLAYAKAAENQNIDHFKTMLAEHQKALQADMEAQEEYEKEKAAKKASKKPRKSEVTVAEDDEMDIDQEAPVEKPKSKKRKKAEDEEDVEEKVRLVRTLRGIRLTTASLRRPQRQPQSSSYRLQRHQRLSLRPKRRRQSPSPRLQRAQARKRP